MDKKTEEVLVLIEELRVTDDIVYEVFRKEKRSGWFHFVDMLFDLAPSATASLMTDKVMYLIASENGGKIVEVDNKEIKNTIEVPNWDSSQKEKFKKIVIGDYLYKKFKKIS